MMLSRRLMPHFAKSPAVWADAMRATDPSYLTKVIGAVGLAGTAGFHSTSTGCEAAGTTFPNIRLYQYDVCPFCNKVQTFLEYNQIPFEKVEVNPLTKKEMKFSEYQMVPFAVMDSNGQSEQVNGSAAIIDKLIQDYPAISENISSKGTDEINKWCSWVDDHLVHLLPVNIYRTPKESIQAFEYISSNSNLNVVEKVVTKYTGALAMFLVSKKLIKKYNISEDPRADLIEAIHHFIVDGLKITDKDIKEKKIKQVYLTGSDKPTKADLAVYGVLRSIDGNYDTWYDLMKKDLKPFWLWYYNMKKLVNHTGAKQ